MFYKRVAAIAEYDYILVYFCKFVNLFFKRQSPVRSIEEPSGASRYGDITYHN